MFLTSAARPADFPADAGLELAVVGRSNSGKSSAINALVGSKKLARTSKTPGRTQLVNFFALAPDRRIVDLPGYGFARVPSEVRARWRALIEAYFAARRSLAGLIITVDIRRELTELDRSMLAFAADLDLDCLVLLTKADKLSRGAALTAERRFRAAAGDGVQTIVFSTRDGQGVAAARHRLEDWLQIGS